MKQNTPQISTYRNETLQALSARQAQLIDAIAARIFPTTDTPGAAEAGAVFYIDQALAGPYPELLPVYAAALRAVDRHSKEKFTAAFVKLAREQQDAVLKDFAADSVPKFLHHL